MFETLENFGITPDKLFFQFIFALVCFGLPLWASLRIMRTQKGAAVPLWLLFIWLVPVIAPLIALDLSRFIGENDD